MPVKTSQALAMKLADSCLKVAFLQMKSESSFCLTEISQWRTNE